MSHTSSISVPASLLFPRQQWQRIFPRRTQPIAFAVVWVLVLFGSVELAASACAYIMFQCIFVWVCVGKWRALRGHVHVLACIIKSCEKSCRSSCVSEDAAEFS